MFFWSIRCRCPIHISRWKLIKVPVPTSLCNSSGSTFDRIARRLSDITGPKYFLGFVLSKAISVFLSDLFMVRVSAP